MNQDIEFLKNKKILLLNYADSGGGAAIAAFRLTNALRDCGINACLGVCDKKTDSPYVFKLPLKKKSKFSKLLYKLYKFLVSLLKIKSPEERFQTTNGIVHSLNKKSKINIEYINNSDFDLVNLHWINSDMISIKDISRIKKPIVWTMHDSWPCCGAEHHPNLIENDERYKTGYYKHNKPATTSGPDLCRYVWNKKNKYFSNMKINFIAPSNWEHNILKTSLLFGKSNCIVIPNIIPANLFFQKPKKSIKDILCIPNKKKVIGFGAATDIDNPKSMKGSYYLINALNKLNNIDDYFLILFGPASENFTKKINIPYFAAGYISNEFFLSILYSVCDCFINPSLIENLPTTSLEALFCGTPTVCFNVGGSSDVVSHKITGYLATPYSINDLVTGINYCLNNYKELSKNCTEKAKTYFNNQTILSKYIDYYTMVLKDD